MRDVSRSCCEKLTGLYPIAVTEIDKLLSDVKDMSASEKNAIESLRAILKMAPDGAHCEGLRMAWLKLQFCIAQSPAMIPVAKFQALGAVLRDIYYSSELIDRFEDRLDTATSLKFLFYKQTSLMEHLKDILEGESELCRYMGVFAFLSSEFIDNVTKIWPLEVITILIQAKPCEYPQYWLRYRSMLNHWSGCLNHCT